MSTQNFMRVLLAADKKVSVAFETGKTVVCTGNILKSILMDPFAFYDTQYRYLTYNTREVNPKNFSLEEVPGITLAYVNKDREIVVVFSELLRQFFCLQQQHQMSKQISLADLLTQERLSDEKQFLVRYFMEFADKFTMKLHLDRRLNLDEMTQARILRELANTLYSELPVIRSGTPDLDETDICREEETVLPLAAETPAPTPKFVVPAGYVTVDEYARKHGRQTGTVRCYINRGKINNYCKDEKGKLWLDPYEVVEDGRKHRKDKVREDGRKRVRLKGDSYEDVQEYIRDRNLFTDVVRVHLRTKEEVRFYDKRRYKEVHWPDNQIALIIDINPDYVVESRGMTNRELIQNGESPICPDDGKPYHLHHISQRADSPLAIIPASVHDSKDYFSILHAGASSDCPIDRKKFDAEKKRFWRTYIMAYDKAGSYRRLHCENSRHKCEYQ